jgi:hypothetical protein
MDSDEKHRNIENHANELLPLLWQFRTCSLAESALVGPTLLDAVALSQIPMPGLPGCSDSLFALLLVRHVVRKTAMAAP